MFEQIPGRHGWTRSAAMGMAMVLVAAAGLVAPPLAGADPIDGAAQHLSRVDDGNDMTPSISDDGQFIVYNSSATKDGEYVGRVVLADRQTGALTPIGPIGAARGQISADGSTVVYVASSPTPCAGPSSYDVGVYRWQRSTGVSTRITPMPTCTIARDGLYVSADGRYVIYTEWVFNGSHPGLAAVRRYDAVSASTTSVVAGQATGMSGNGRFITYTTGTDGPATAPLLLWDNVAQTTTAVAPANASTAPVSDDGRYVVYQPLGRKIVSRDMVTGDTVSVDGGSLAFGPDMSPDGRFVAYSSDYTGADIWDRTTGARTPIGSEFAAEAAVSADGSHAAFTSGRGEGLPVNYGNSGIYLWTRASDPSTFPDTPTAPVGTAATDQVALTWTAPPDGGSPIVGYRITPILDGTALAPVDVTNVTSTVITGLRGGAGYTFTVAARNLRGRTLASPPSTPVAPKSTVAESFVAATFQDYVGRLSTEAELTFGLAVIGDASSIQRRSQFTTALAGSDTYLGAVVNKLYVDTLDRTGEPGGVAYWTDQLRTGKVTVAQTAGLFYASPEYFTGFGQNNLTTWVTDLYRKILLRNPDPGGLAYYVDLAKKTDRYTVAALLYQSPESSNTRVKGLYQHFLGRPADQSGLGYWASKISSLGDLELARNLTLSPEYVSNAAVRYP